MKSSVNNHLDENYLKLLENFASLHIQGYSYYLLIY